MLGPRKRAQRGTEGRRGARAEQSRAGQNRPQKGQPSTLSAADVRVGRSPTLPVEACGRFTRRRLRHDDDYFTLLFYVCFCLLAVLVCLLVRSAPFDAASLRGCQTTADKQCDGGHERATQQAVRLRASPNVPSHGSCTVCVRGSAHYYVEGLGTVPLTVSPPSIRVVRSRRPLVVGFTFAGRLQVGRCPRCTAVVCRPRRQCARVGPARA